MTLFSPGTRVVDGGNVRPRKRGKGFTVVADSGEKFGLLPAPDSVDAGFDTYLPSLPPDASNRTLLVDHSSRKMFWGQLEHSSLGSLENDDHAQYFNDTRLTDWINDWLGTVRGEANGLAPLDSNGSVPLNFLPMGVANGIASLDSNGLVPSNQLPSYVDDVLEYADLASFPGTGETGKIYVAIDSGRTYRWGGSSYAEISPSTVLSVNGQTGTVSLTTSDIAEGTNLYYTAARFNSALAGKTTADLAEGSNLYYTASRFNTAFAAKSTTDLAEGTNLYHTTARARAAFSAGTGIGLASGVISNSGVTSITGTTNQIVRDASTGDVTLSLPQSIGTGSSPTFAGMTLSGTASGLLVAERTGLTSDAFDSSTTNNVMAIRAKKSTDMSFGFGPTLLFQAQDDTSAVVNAGCIASRWAAAGDASFDMVFHAGGSPRMTLAYNGRLGVGITNNLLAYFHAGAGTTSVAPIKLTNGTNLTTPLSGAIEYDNTFLFTQSDGTRRNVMLANTSAPDTSGAPFTNTGKKTVRIGGTDFTFMTCAP